jgi:hypothetical protein
LLAAAKTLVLLIMRVSLASIISLSGLLFYFTSFSQTPSTLVNPADAQTFALLVRFEGDVEYLRAGRGQPSRPVRGERLFAGDTLITGNNGRALLVFPGNETRLNVAPESRLVLNNLLFTAPSASDGGVNQTDLTLEYGDLVGRVRSLDRDNPNHRFHIRTAVGVAGIRGTTFRIRYIPPVDNQPPLLEISTLEGLVVVLPVELFAVTPTATEAGPTGESGRTGPRSGNNQEAQSGDTSEESDEDSGKSQASPQEQGRPVPPGTTTRITAPVQSGNDFPSPPQNQDGSGPASPGGPSRAPQGEAGDSGNPQPSAGVEIEAEGIPINQELSDRISEAAENLDLNPSEEAIVFEVLAALNPLIANTAEEIRALRAQDKIPSGTENDTEETGESDEDAQTTDDPFPDEDSVIDDVETDNDLLSGQEN